MGFDGREGERPIQNAPDFTAGLATYTAQVEAISIQIKAGQAELDDLRGRIGDAKTDLQAQYSKTVNDLGDQILISQDQLAALRGQVASLEAQIKERQATKDAISLDNTAERAKLDASWAELQKSTANVNAAIAQVEKDKRDTAESMLALEAAKKEFDAFEKSRVDAISTRVTEIVALEAQAKKKMADAEFSMSLTQSAQDQVEKSLAELKAKTDAAQEVLDNAAAVRAQAEKNAADQAYNSAQALQNQKDIQEIQVARVALNNLRQELASREQMVSQAEAKIGG